METYNSANIDKKNQDDDISLDLNINSIKSFFIRSRKLITISIISIMVPSFLYSLIRKPTYEGTFQIVLSNEDRTNKSIRNTGSLLDQYAGMADFLNIGGGSSKKLQTEVKILESPLILMPAYEYVKKVLSENGTNIDGLRFYKWKKNLNINLIKKTSVLEISYKDKNKKLIIPILNLISKDYQKYSGRDRLRSLNNGIKYLEDQIKVIEEQSRLAYKNAFLFAVKHNLDTTIIKTKSNSLFSNNLNQEKNNLSLNKYEASIELEFIEQQLKNLKNINNKNASKLLYDYQDEETGLYKKLVNLDKKIIDAKSKFQETDIFVSDLISERDRLINTIIENKKSFLESKKSRYQELLKSLDRPNEVLIKDRELKSEANRLVSIYDEMISKLQINKLEKAKKTDPWELISNPTLKEEPLGLKNYELPFIGIIFGSIVGTLIAKFKEDKKDLIFEFKTLNQLINQTKLCQLSINHKNLWNQYIQIICDEQKDMKDINLIYLGNSSTYKKEINDLFLNCSQKLSVDNKLDKQKIHILIAESGKINKFELFSFQQKIDLIKPNIMGIIFIS